MQGVKINTRTYTQRIWLKWYSSKKYLKDTILMDTFTSDSSHKNKMKQKHL